MSEVVLPAFDQETGLCVVRTYKAYVTRTKRYRKSSGKLFIITVKPFTPVSRDAFGKWGRPLLSIIIKTSGWEPSNTFQKFYDRPINRSVIIADKILESGL